MTAQRTAVGGERRTAVNRPSSIVRRRSDAAIAIGLALALFGVAMLTWSGTFHSSDGLSMYAAADSLARYGRFDVEQIRWMDVQQGTYGPDGLLYSRKGLGTTVLVFPFVLIGLLLPGIGPVHTALVLTPLATAISGALLYVAGRRAFPALPRSAAVLATLAWGVAGMAWPYSKTLFSDPVVALTMIGAFERLIALQRARSAEAELRASLGLGVWLGLGVLTRAAHGVVVPIFGLAFLWILWSRRNTQYAIRNTNHLKQLIAALLRPTAALATPLLLAGLLALWYNWHRFGNPFNSGYLPEESFRAIWWRGIVGQLVSPGRGLLWYMPWLVLVVPAVRWVWRRAPVALSVAGGSFLAYLLLYGKWYMWHGGFAWGPRFLVPTLPLLAWLAVPAAARWRRPFVGLAVLGVAINAIGAVWDFAPHQQWLEAQLPLFDPRTFFELEYAQIPGMLRLGLTSQPVDVAWMVDGRLRPTLLVLAALVALLGIGAGVYGTGEQRRRGAEESGSRGDKGTRRQGDKETRGKGTRWTGSPMLIGAALLMVAATYLLLWQARAGQSAAYHEVVRRIEADGSVAAMIWHDDPEQTPTLLNLYEGSAPILGANVTSETPSEQLAARLPTLASSPRAVWIVTDGPPAPVNALDRAAMRHKGRVDEFTSGDTLRAAYYFDAADWDEQQVDVTFVGNTDPLIRMVSAGVTADGRIAAVRLEWEALAPIPEDYQMFVHLLGPDGDRVAQNDGPAQNGLAPTSTWDVGMRVEDVRALYLPTEAPAGEYTFLVGLYRLDDLSRLMTEDGRDAVRVGTVYME